MGAARRPRAVTKATISTTASSATSGTTRLTGLRLVDRFGGRQANDRLGRFDR